MNILKDFSDYRTNLFDNTEVSLVFVKKNQSMGSCFDIS